MVFREAQITDIPQIQIVRNAVKENILSDPSLVTDADCVNYLTLRGKGWVCEIEKQIVGFSIVDLQGKDVWALFVHPDFEAKGIGKKLHDEMLDWYFSKSQETITLGTDANTRAEKCYQHWGWKEIGRTKLTRWTEVKFEMTSDVWFNTAKH